jgi:hypothetical protein
MKMNVKVSPSRVIELQAEKQKDLFKALASAHEVFGEKECGLCKCPDIVPVWRTATRMTGKKVETFEFPEYHCQNPKCRARLSLGTINDDTGTLFPQRRLMPDGKVPGKQDNKEHARHGDHRGWTTWRPKRDEEGGE